MTKTLDERRSSAMAAVEELEAAKTRIQELTDWRLRNLNNPVNDSEIDTLTDSLPRLERANRLAQAEWQFAKDEVFRAETRQLLLGVPVKAEAVKSAVGNYEEALLNLVDLALTAQHQIEEWTALTNILARREAFVPTPPELITRVRLLDWSFVLASPTPFESAKSSLEVEGRVR